jgi:hypothetical protein
LVFTLCLATDTPLSFSIISSPPMLTYAEYMFGETTTQRVTAITFSIVIPSIFLAFVTYLVITHLILVGPERRRVFYLVDPPEQPEAHGEEDLKQVAGSSGKGGADGADGVPDLIRLSPDEPVGGTEVLPPADGGWQQSARSESGSDNASELARASVGNISVQGTDGSTPLQVPLMMSPQGKASSKRVKLARSKKLRKVSSTGLSTARMARGGVQSLFPCSNTCILSLPMTMLCNPQDILHLLQ